MSSVITRAKPKRPPLIQKQRWRSSQKCEEGLFITFEGGEGAGKSTLISSLREHLLQQNSPLLCTREPGGSTLGEQIRSHLLLPSQKTPLSARAELCLFLASRAQHIEEVILPALRQGKVILCDRFNDSTIAYQGVGRNLGIDYVSKLCTMICQGLSPDITFYLDIEPEIGLKRSTTLDRIEQETLAFHSSVREAFLQLANREKHRFFVIDAHRSAREVFDQVLAIIEGRLHRGTFG